MLQLSARHATPSQSIQELRNAFDLVERASPGMTDLFVTDVVSSLLPDADQRSLTAALDRYTSTSQLPHVFIL